MGMDGRDTDLDTWQRFCDKHTLVQFLTCPSLLCPFCYGSSTSGCKHTAKVADLGHDCM